MIGCEGGPIYIDRISRAKVQFVNIYITTPIGVKCPELKNYFGTQLKERSVEDPHELDQLVNHLNNVINKRNKYTTAPDTRIRIELLDTKSNLLESICIGSVSLEYNDDVYSINDEFRDFIVEYLKNLP